MASSSDAVRNFVYDVHLCDLRQGWNVVQELETRGLDSWEKIYARYPVTDLSEHDVWDDNDEQKVASFGRECPLLGDKLAAQLAAQASLFVRNPKARSLRKSNNTRLGSLRERINRLYLREKVPSVLNITFAGSKSIRFNSSKKEPRLVPFAEAVTHPGFTA